MKKLVIVFILLFNVAYAGSYQTGNNMLPACQEYIAMLQPNANLNTLEYIHASVCLGYVEGSLDAELDVFYGKDKLAYKGLNTFLSDTPMSQIIRVYVQYMQNNPKYLGNDAATLLFLSLADMVKSNS